MKIFLACLAFCLQPLIWVFVYIQTRYLEKYVFWDLIVCFTAILFMFYTAGLIAYLTSKADKQ